MVWRCGSDQGRSCLFRHPGRVNELAKDEYNNNNLKILNRRSGAISTTLRDPYWRPFLRRNLKLGAGAHTHYVRAPSHHGGRGNFLAQRERAR